MEAIAHIFTVVCLIVAAIIFVTAITDHLVDRILK
jgi:hypothetical protein